MRADLRVVEPHTVVRQRLRFAHIRILDKLGTRLLDFLSPAQRSQSFKNAGDMVSEGTQAHLNRYLRFLALVTNFVQLTRASFLPHAIPVLKQESVLQLD